MPCPPSPSSPANDYPVPLWLSSGGIQGPAGKSSDRIFDGTILYNPCTSVFGSPAPTTIAEWACQVEQKWISKFDLTALPTGTAGQVLAKEPGATNLYKPQSLAAAIAKAYTATPHTVFSTNASGTAGFYPLGSGFYQVVSGNASSLVAGVATPMSLTTGGQPATAYNDFAGSITQINANPTGVALRFTVPVSGRWAFRAGGNFWFNSDSGGSVLSSIKATLTVTPAGGAGAAQTYDIALESSNPAIGENWYVGAHGGLPSLQLGVGSTVDLQFWASGPSGSNVSAHGAGGASGSTVPFGGTQAGYFTGTLERL